MTISVHAELSSDLVRNRSWPLFCVRKELHDPSLAAYTVNWTSSNDDLEDFVFLASEEMDRALKRASGALSYVIHIFLVHLTLQPIGAAVLHRGLWKAPWAKSVPSDIMRGGEFRLDCDGRVRFAAVAGVEPTTSLGWLLLLAREFEMVIPILVPSPLSLSQDTARSLAYAGLPPDGCRADGTFDWPNFVHQLAATGGIAVRAGINLADRQISVDFFGAENDIAPLPVALTNR